MAASRRQWGWHALRPQWAEQVVADAHIPPGAWVVDVGAGRGALTEPLLRAGARVIAVEFHPARAADLRGRFGRDVTVVDADARDLRLPRRSYHVVASPPYSATTEVLRRLVSAGSRLESAHLVLQEQAARRWASPAAPAAARWQRLFVPSLGRRVPPLAFTPPPHVPSRVLVLRRRMSPGAGRSMR